MISALFPGQGSQHTGMGQFLYENFPTAKQTFEEASDAIKVDMKKLCFSGPEDELNLTKNTQPAILTVSVATIRVLNEAHPVKFDFAAGHSVGEYAAFVLSESLDFSTAVKAVHKRGEFMQEAVPIGQGGMVAVMGLTSEQTEYLCQWAEKESGLKPISPANYNAPGQVVCSGSQKLISWLSENVKKEVFDPPPKRLKLIPLKVSAPFHCSMMKPAEEKMRILLEDTLVNNAKIPIIQNVNAEVVSEASSLRENLIQQITGSVKWSQSIEKMTELGVQKAIELGAGKVLSGLTKKISGDLKVFSLNSLDDLKSIEQSF